MAFVVAISALYGCGRPGTSQPVTLTVSVAASLQNAISEIRPAFERAHPGVKLTVNFGGSGSLAQQVESGAPVDVFVSAAAKPVDRLAAKGLLLPGTRRDLLRNRLVLVAASGGTSVRSFQDLARVKLIALGDPESVPAGDYGRQALQSLRIWNTVEKNLVLAKDVRQVLSYVETGNADAGIVYETDARESAKVRVVAVAPDSSHAPIVYPAAVTRDSRNPAAARGLIAYLASPEAGAIFTRHGFTTVSP